MVQEITITTTTTITIDLDFIAQEIQELQDLADSINYIELPEGISQEIITLINIENLDRELKKAYALDKKLQKEIEKSEYIKNKDK